MDNKDIAALVATVYGEARGEISEGQHAVADVILNRALKQKKSVYEVCHAPYQFSCWNEKDPNHYAVAKLESLVLVVLDRADDEVPDATKGSTHYCTEDVHPYWAEGHIPVVKIGHHLFYNDVN